jgi:ABC-2 type transport system ATP-binding protein/lipopolysaccharide transport system ATP-binding protein
MSSPIASDLGAAPPPAAAEAPVVVSLQNVSVRYRLPREPVHSIKEFAIRWLKRKMVYEHFVALHDVSLEVRHGEVLGIIGHNGAGKSTLLRLIARVLQPTEGRVMVRGRVAPLLELGAGFDRELTGRENVYLNGAVLGFRRADIEERFDRIVDFAGVREFIDLPLRMYSSGMVARLGFAVATDIPPGILIVDEVLGVGDADFTKKSEQRIRELHDKSEAVLMVSHDLHLMRQMCHRIAWLHHGRLRAVGAPDDVVEQYETAVRQPDWS